MTESSSITIGTLCEKLGVVAPAGCAEKLITGISTLECASDTEVSFVQKTKYLEAAKGSSAGLILAPAGIVVEGHPVVHVPDVMGAVLTVIAIFHPDPQKVSFRDATALVASSAIIGRDVYIGPHVIIEDDVVIGDGSRIEAFCFIGHGARLAANCWLSPRVTIQFGSRLGARVRVHPGTVIGADGFRYEMTKRGMVKIPQVGVVVIEDDVEIGANTTIDRAFLTETRIGARTKIDNQVHIGHNVIIGSDCVIVAQVGIAGSVKIGRGVLVGGKVGIKDHVTIGDGAKIAGNSAVQNNLPPGAEVMGFPAIPIKKYARFSTFYRQFDENWKKIKTVLDDIE